MNVAMRELVSNHLAHGRRLAELLGRIERAVAIGDWSEARRRFALFLEEIDKHMRNEEEILVPVFDAALNSDAPRSAALFHVAHAQLGELVDQLAARLFDEHPDGRRDRLLRRSVRSASA